jgi:hypothetical protein
MSFNSELTNPPDDSQFPPHDPHVDVNIEWARMILLGLGIAGAFVAVAALAALLWLANMVVSWNL